MYRNKEVQNAMDLAKQGRRGEARSLLEGLLGRDPFDPEIWAAKAQLAETETEAIYCWKQVLRRSPGNSEALEALARLGVEVKQKEEEEDRETLLPFWLISAVVAVVVLAVLTSVFFIPFWQSRQRGGASASPTAALSSGPTDILSTLEPLTCERLIREALSRTNERCQQIGPNQACYGHYTVQAELLQSGTSRFDIPGDVVSVGLLQELVVSPMDIANGDWGIAVFKVQATLPRTVPGQNVTFLAFGDTSIDNTIGNMQVFSFASGLGGIVCEQVPFNGILVTMPDGTGITIQVNSTGLTLLGPTILRSIPHREMTVAMLGGSGRVSVQDQVQYLGAGQEVKIPLGGDSGTAASGPPSEPELISSDSLTIGCTFLGIGCPPAAIATISADEARGAVQSAIALSQLTSTPTRSPLPTNTPRPTPRPRSTRVPPTPVPIPTSAPADDGSSAEPPPAEPTQPSGQGGGSGGVTPPGGGGTTPPGSATTPPGSATTPPGSTITPSATQDTSTPSTPGGLRSEPLFINIGNPGVGICQGGFSWGGYTWEQNQSYTPGSYGFRGGVQFGSQPHYDTPQILDSPGGNWVGPEGQRLLSCRMFSSSFEYVFDNLAAGNWQITIYFVENSVDGPGERLFSVTATSGGSSQTVLQDLDIYRAAGGKYIYITRQFQVAVNDSYQLVLSFVASRNNAIMSAIGIEYLGP